MAAIPVWMVIASAAVSAVSAVRQGQATAAAAEYNSKVAQQNAQIADAQGIAASEAQDRDARRRIGAMVAAYGASGVELGSGSPADVLADSARMAALDNLSTKYNYKLRALGYQQQAGLNNLEAQSARSAGYLNAASAAMNGAGRALPYFG